MFFFFQAEDGIRDHCVTGVQTCALPICPAFFSAHFSLRQRLRFLKCQSLVAAAPHFLYCPFPVAAAPPLLLLTFSRCGSAPAFYTVHFSLRQRPRFLKCPCLVATAPPLLFLTGSSCGSAPLFILPISRCESAHRSEEHTSELQSHSDLVCRLLLEKKKN